MCVQVQHSIAFDSMAQANLNLFWQIKLDAIKVLKSGLQTVKRFGPAFEGDHRPA